MRDGLALMPRFERGGVQEFSELGMEFPQKSEIAATGFLLRLRQAQPAPLHCGCAGLPQEQIETPALLGLVQLHIVLDVKIIQLPISPRLEFSRAVPDFPRISTLVRRTHDRPRFIGTTLPPVDAGVSQYFAHASISPLRFANRSPRR